MREFLKHWLRSAGYRLERVRPRRPTPTRTIAHLPELVASDVRYHSGDWRYRVDLDEVVGRPCFGYGPHSWHPFVAAVREILENPAIPYEESVLASFYRSWQPQTTSEAQFPGSKRPPSVLDDLPVERHFNPWLLRPKPCDDPMDPRCRPPGAPLYGPVTLQEGEREHNRLKMMIDSLQTYGYDPDNFPRGLITGYVLRFRGQQKFLVVHGQHRTAALSALGITEIEVGIRRKTPIVIEDEDVERWPHVRSGLVTAELALEQMARYFPSGPGEDPGLIVARFVEGRPIGDG